MLQWGILVVIGAPGHVSIIMILVFPGQSKIFEKISQWPHFSCKSNRVHWNVLQDGERTFYEDFTTCYVLVFFFFASSLTLQVLSCRCTFKNDLSCSTRFSRISLGWQLVSKVIFRMQTTSIMEPIDWHLNAISYPVPHVIFFYAFLLMFN